MAAFSILARGLAVAAFLVVGCSAALLPTYQSCLHGPDGLVSCKFSVPETILSVSRQACAVNDHSCLCLKSVEYNNAVRGRHGKAPIAVGNMAMLENDIKHCKEMEGGPFEHQKLDKVTSEIQCKVFCSGENIAKFGGPSDDPAKKCMDMWENSPGHLENIKRDNDYTTIGIYTSNDVTYCTQTFGLKGSGEGSAIGPKCAPVGGVGSVSPTDSAPTSTSTKVETTTAVTEAPSTTKVMQPTTETTENTTEPLTNVKATTVASTEVSPTRAIPKVTTTCQPSAEAAERSGGDTKTYPGRVHFPTHSGSSSGTGMPSWYSDN